jgi:ribosome-associated protein
MQEEISKTQRKKEMLELQALGVALVELSDAHLESLELDATLKKAILEARRITSHEAKRRQLQYIGRLMRDLDPAPIRSMLEALDSGSAESNAAHRRVEAWRERLLEDDAALTAFATEYPGADTQVLRSLIRNSRKEKAEAKPPRAFRELFRFIKACSSSSPS